MNSLEFYFASKWLSENLPGAKTDKGFFRFKNGDHGIEFYSSLIGGKRTLRFSKGVLGFLPEKPPESERESWKFGREFLSGFPVESVSQVGFDRILRIDFSSGNSLVFEAFDGNLMLLKGEKIVFAKEQREWKGRKIFPGENYIPPAQGQGKKPESLSGKDFSQRDETLGKILASVFGFGPEIGKVIISLSGVENKQSLSETEGELVASSIKRLFSGEGKEPVFSLLEPGKGEKSRSEIEREKRIARLEESISNLEVERSQASFFGNALLSRISEVDWAISEARKGRVVPPARELKKAEGRIVVSIPSAAKE